MKIPKQRKNKSQAFHRQLVFFLLQTFVKKLNKCVAAKRALYEQKLASVYCRCVKYFDANMHSQHKNVINYKFCLMKCFLQRAFLNHPSHTSCEHSETIWFIAQTASFFLNVVLSLCYQKRPCLLQKFFIKICVHFSAQKQNFKDNLTHRYYGLLAIVDMQF